MILVPGLHRARQLAGLGQHLEGDRGDLAVGGLDDRGYLDITDRKREFIKTLGGDMVSPAKLEALLMAEPEIHQAVVAAEGQPGIVAADDEGGDAPGAVAFAGVGGGSARPETCRGRPGGPPGQPQLPNH